jgi:spore maturation protein CgeB
MKTIVFLKQSSIVRGQMHVESHVEDALRRREDIALTVIDLVTEVHQVHSAARDYDTIMRRYYDHCVEKICGCAPDGVLFLGGYAINNLFPELFTTLKKRKIPLMAWHADDPYYFDLQQPLAEYFDYIFTVEESTVALWKEYTPRSYYCPFACDSRLPSLLEQWHGDESYCSDICLIGAPFKGSYRVEVIDSNAEVLCRYATKIMGATKVDTWKKSLSHYSRLKACIRDEFIDPEESYRYYANAKVNCNIHKDSYGHQWDKNSQHLIAHSPNERFFTIAGIGGFQVVDTRRRDLFGMFGEENVVSFDSPETFGSTVEQWLSDDAGREECARRLQEVVLREHTYDNRIDVICKAMDDEE